MGQVAETILSSGRLVRMYADAVLKDVPREKFARLAEVNGTKVQSNHPAFVFGHLSLYYPRVLTLLGQQAPANPPMFEELFMDGKPCVDDPTGTKYPSMDAILNHFRNGYEAATAALAKATDADLAKPNPAESRMKELFPTVGSVINFYLSAHAMSHIGQVSAWRRMVGLGSAM